MTMSRLDTHAHEALAFIRAFLTEHDGVSPTFRQIMRGTGINSLGYMARIMDQLERTEKLQRMPRRARAIQLGPPRQPDIHLPDIDPPPQIIATLCPKGIIS